jgi:hypothetical protein
MAAEYNITVRADRDFWLPIHVQTGEGNPCNFTGYTIVLTVKGSINDADASALFKSAPYTSSLQFGTFTFRIPRATNNAWWTPSGAITSTMVYDCSCQDVSAPANWATLLEGTVSVIGPVTRTVGIP